MRTRSTSCASDRVTRGAGAPALGAAGAMGVALAAVRGEPLDAAAARAGCDAGRRRSTWHGASRARGHGERTTRCAAAAELAADDVAGNRALGAFGAALIADGARADALQHGVARDRRLRHRARRRPRRGTRRASASASGSTRRGRCCRARASPRGSSAARHPGARVIADSDGRRAHGARARSTS